MYIYLHKLIILYQPLPGEKNIMLMGRLILLILGTCLIIQIVDEFYFPEVDTKSTPFLDTLTVIIVTFLHAPLTLITYTIVVR